MTNQKVAEKFWDRISKNYGMRANNDRSFKKTIEIAKKHLASDDIVLDFGCATGIYSNELAGDVKDIHGIDISSGMIEKAKSNSAPNATFTKASIFEKYEKETFHTILAFNVLHLVENPHQVMQRINELLKPGGLFISVTPCIGEKYSFLNIFLRILRKVHILPTIKCFKNAELNQLIEGHFQTVATDHLPPMQILIVAKKT